MKNKKGFTLIELMAVVLVLGIILIIAVPTVRHLVKKQRTNYYESTDENILLSVKDYFNSNRNLRPKGAYGRKVIDLATLINEDYINNVFDADGRKTCSGYGMVVNTGSKDYKYYTCLKCNCTKNICEYETDTRKIYKTDVNLCTDNYNPAAYIKVPNTLYSYNGLNIDSNKLIGHVYIKLNDKDIDWKVLVTPSNEDIININENNKYTLDYNYINDEVSYILGDVNNDGIVDKDDFELALRLATNQNHLTPDQLLRVDIDGDGVVTVTDARTILRCVEGIDTTKCYTTNELKAKSDVIVYQYKAPNVTPVGFDWGKAVQNTIKITLTPDGILPDNVTSPKFTVSKYQISYVKEGSNNWSEYKDITCSINSNNKCNNGQFDISKLESGTYKLKFRFIDTKNNISLETNNEAYKIIVKPLTCPIITANNINPKTWTNKTVTLNLQHNDSYTSWEWYTNNSTGGWENWGINKTETSKDLIAEGERQGKIVIKNSAGETKECLTNIYYIDKTAPICTKVAKKIDSNGKDYTNKTWINENVYTSATCSDSLSGCRSNNVRSVTTTGKTTNVTDQFQSSWTVKAEGKSTVTWSVYDAAGNKGTCSVIEPYIDKTPPIIYYRYIQDACFKSAANNNISSTMIYLVVDPKTKANDVSGVNLYASKHCYKDLSQSLIQSCKYQKLEARDWAIRTVSPSFKEEVEGHYNFWTEKEIVYFIMKATDNAGNEVISSLINPIEFTTSNNCTVDQWNSRSYDDVIKDAKKAGFYPVTSSNYERNINN